MLAASALALMTASARAHSVESLVSVQLDPVDPSRMLVRYSNGTTASGLLYSNDDGASFSLLCTAAVGEAATTDAANLEAATAVAARGDVLRARSMLIAGDGTTLIGSNSGLFRDRGNGCDWQLVPELAGLWIAGTTLHATRPALSYAITNGQSKSANEGLWQRDQQGAWTQLAPTQVANSGERWSTSGLLAGGHADRTRFYSLSLRSGGELTRLHSYLQRSDDQGRTWQEQLLEVPAQAGVSLLAVDPTNSDRLLIVYQRVDAAGDWDKERDTVLLSQDGGKTFVPYLELTEVGAALFEPDGTLWLGDAGKITSATLPIGLYRAAPGLAQKPQLVSADRPVTCLGKRPESSALYLCMGTKLGRYEPEQDRFTALMELASVQRIHSCEGRDVVADCQAQLCTSWCGPDHFASAPACGVYDEPLCGPRAVSTSRVSLPEDAGVVGDAAVDADADSNPHSKGADGGCSVHSRAPTAATAWLWLLAAGAWLAARRAQNAPRRRLQNAESR